MNLIKINNQNLDLGVSLHPNIFAFHVLDKNKKHVRTIVAEYADGLPFETNHRHFVDYIADVQSSIVREFYNNFKLDKAEAAWFGDEVITNECGNAIYFSKFEI